jgi:hypothetical protein
MGAPTMSEETEPMPLSGDRREHRKFMRFDPTVSAGTIMQFVGLLLMFGAAWATYQSDKATQKLETDQIKQQAVNDRIATKESITELKIDLREMQRTLISVDKGMSSLQSELSNATKKGPSK